MKHLSFLPVLLLASFTAHSASDEAGMKRFTLGVGTYNSVILYDNSLVGSDDKLSGAAFTFGYSVSDQLAFRGTYFTLEHDDDSNIKSTGYDLLGYLGTGLATPGLKAYVGGGFFSDKWKGYSNSKTFSGLQLSAGVGYNWNAVALEFILNIRDASDYEDFVNQNSIFNTNAAAGSGSLLLSYRF